MTKDYLLLDDNILSFHIHDREIDYLEQNKNTSIKSPNNVIVTTANFE